MRRARAAWLILAAFVPASFAYSAHAEALTDGMHTIAEIPVSSAKTATTSAGRTVFSTTSAQDNAPKDTPDSIRALLIAQDHRVTMTEFVHALLYVANTEFGNPRISGQIRSIAEREADAVATTTEALEQTGARSSLKRLLFGSNYAQLQTLKHDLIRIQNHLEELRALAKEADTPASRAILETQIQHVEKQATSIKDFVLAHEKGYGMFGWISRALVGGRAYADIANNS
jgi:hypothetical protein